MSGLDQLRPSWVRKINVARVQDLVPGECWLWTGSNVKGYGRVTIAHKGRSLHRVVYERMVGPIPDGLHIDHLCRQPPCCNPAHLEPVTPLVNVRRGVGHGSETHCPQGHDYSGDNLIVAEKAKGGPRRICRLCRDENMRKFRERLAERKRQTWALYLPDLEDAA